MRCIRQYLSLKNLIAAATAILLVLPTLAVQPPARDVIPGDGPAMRSPLLEAEATLEWFDPESRAAAAYPALLDFLAEYGEAWELVLDLRSNRPDLLSGSGVPLVPGPGNTLKSRELGIKGEVTLADVERQVRTFLDRHPDLFDVERLQLKLDGERSLALGGEHGDWLLELRQLHDGVPVEGAALFFRLAAGNATQFGARRLAAVEMDSEPGIGAEAAFFEAAATFDLATAEAPDAKLSFLPVLGQDEMPGEPFTGFPGTGWSHRLVWTWTFAPKGSDGTALGTVPDAHWRLRVDAHTGEVLEFVDETLYAQAKGDIVPTEPTDALDAGVPLPFMEVGLGGSTVYTDANGNYIYPGSGTQAAGRLFGTYVKTYDGCGTIWHGNWTTGELDFQGVPQPAAACDVPAVGGLGNTNAARTTYVHLSEQQHDARCRFNGCTGTTPFPWLANNFQANTNDVWLPCNAAWFQGFNLMVLEQEANVAGYQCRNTGINRPVLIHEWAHGFDNNTGGSAPDKGTGEAFADTFAFIESEDGCIGRGFFIGPGCHNCGPICDGIRDLPAYSLGGSRPLARPSTVEHPAGLNCAPTIYDPDTGIDYVNCPYRDGWGNPYQGPMGYQGHCESHIASTANWDLRESLRTRWGAAAGDSIFEELWWDAAVPVGSAYRLVGSQCNPDAQVDGCAADNWYRVLLQMDDDNGNLADGTPNGCRIFDAYAAHGIACGQRPPCSADPACVPPPASIRAWWPMDVTSSTTTDELIASNNGVIHGDPQVIAGTVGPALSFDGDDYLSVPDCQHLDIGTHDFTILSWVRTESALGTVVAKRTRMGSAYLGYLLQIINGTPLLQIADQAANWINFPATTLPRVDDGQWHLIAASVDRGDTNGARISVDGGLPQEFDPTSRAGSLANAAELRLARSIGDSNDLYLDGDLDEVQIIGRALSQAEIQAIWAAGPSGVCRSPLPLLSACNGGGSN